MTSLKQAIQQNLNPFDPSTFKPGNFWEEEQDLDFEVEAIHWQAIQTIEKIVDCIAINHHTQTILLPGTQGSGKSYLLGRLKRQLNSKAFFAYIGPWPSSDHIWRHTLRSTIDSLIHKPEGSSESQLLLWLKSLPSIRSQSMRKRIFGERGTFIQDLQAGFPSGIYNSKEFFGVLYDLATNPDLYFLAYSWLKGDSLDDESLKALRVQRPIESEDAAQRVLSNIGRLAISTQPIVLCFDNLDSIPRLSNEKLDLQSLFNLNSVIHNEKLKNFLVLISVVNNTWKEHKPLIQPSDLDRISQIIQLKPISLEQAEALWAYRLRPIHSQVQPRPESPITPLTRDWLDHEFPGGKALPRSVLKLGKELISYYKTHGELPKTKEPKGSPGGGGKPPRPDFQLTWDREFKAVRQQVTHMSQFTSPDLIWRLRQVLEVLEVPQIASDFLQGSKFSAYSLSHSQPSRTGIVWFEDRNMTTFYYVMNACQKRISKQTCDQLYFIRSEKLGGARTKGQKIYQELFQAQNNHRHIKPDLLSVQYLETYHRLATAAQGGELVIGSTTPHLKDLQAFVQDSKVLEQCPILKDLSLIEGGQIIVVPPDPPSAELEKYILNVMATQAVIGRITLLESTQQQFPAVESDLVDRAIMALCQQNRMQLVNPDVDLSLQVICHIPA